MRTVLPIPEQEGFRIRLPARVRFSVGTEAEPGEAGLRLVRNETSLSIALAASARDALAAALAENGGGLPTDRLAVTWRQLLEKLAACGMLTEAGAACGPGELPALEALAAVQDRVYHETTAAFTGDGAFDRLLNGQYEQSTALTWLVENYRYTKSASYHVPPVLQHDMEPAERLLWRRFLKDESWHWRIYRPALAQFGLCFDDLDSRPAKPSTRHFIETLHTIACSGPVPYAAAMIFVEKPPLWTEVMQDPLFASLTKHYGFSLSSIRPLWWHATENLSAGHSALGAVVISNRRSVSRVELELALQGVSDTIKAVHAWHEGILTTC
jgi:hypothetical protein